MTKKEIISVIKNVITVNNPDNEFDYYTDIHFMVEENGDVMMRDDNVARNMFQWKNIKYLSKEQLIKYLSYIKKYYEE